MVDLSAEEGYLRGAYTRCKKSFSEKMIQSSQFASLKSESNIIFDNNLTNNYLWSVYHYSHY